jgi:Icc protein
MNINNRKSANLVLIQISDLHIFTNKKDKFAGIDSYQSLQAVLTLIKEDFPDFDAMLVTGDLVQDPELAAYKNMLGLLQTIEQPIYIYRATMMIRNSWRKSCRIVIAKT